MVEKYPPKEVFGLELLTCLCDVTNDPFAPFHPCKHGPFKHPAGALTSPEFVFATPEPNAS
jgi:hypothetical protein